MSTPAAYELPAHQFIAEPDLKFHPERATDVDPHPLQGLRRYGPYSRKVFGAVSDPIRLALIAPAADGPAKVRGLLAELEQRHTPKERTAYLIEFDRFSSTFGVNAVLAEGAFALLSGEVDAALAKSPRPHRVLADYLARAISALNARRSEFDVLLIYLPRRWEAAFKGGAEEDFDLHDFVKGVTASAAVPAQILLESGAMDYRCRCSVMWRLGIALYCKAGGIPWKLAHAEPDTAYVGLGYAVRQNADASRFVTCCSQVFDHEGTGLEFIAYETGDVEVEGDNPFLSRNDMTRIMARSLALYQGRHAGRWPKTVIVHKHHPFKRDETDACLDACRSVERVELVQIQKDVLWRGVHLDAPRVPEKEKSRPGYAARRGSYLIMGGTEALLWTQGNVPQAGGKDFFKEMKGTPSPVMVRRFAGHGTFFDLCNGILGLTKMDWNNDALYDRLPVTLGYASVLAQTLKRIGSLSPRPYPFRLFM